MLEVRFIGELQSGFSAEPSFRTVGSGKTILTANIVSHLLQQLPAKCSVLYIFVRFDDEDSRSADMILRSLTFQGLAGHQIQDSLMGLLENSASKGFQRDTLLSLLSHGISLLEKTYLVVDGLDQCSPQERHTLLQSFAQILQMSDSSGNVKILTSGRESIAQEIEQALAPTKHLRIGLIDTDADLVRYAEEILTEKRERRELIVRDEAIMDQITDKLRLGGEGMFLWAFLTIEDICSCPTDRDIRQTLETLPRKLSETFDRALGRICSSQSSSIVDLVKKTFRWVATVRRPLTRWELGEAMGVEILQGSSLEDQIINGTERLPSWCENLVQIEGGDETVRFFHHSIKTHLLDSKLEATELGEFHIDLKAWDHHIGEICLTYLNFSDFQRALSVCSPDATGVRVRQIALSSEGRGIPAAIGHQAIVNALPDTSRPMGGILLRRYLKPKMSREICYIPQGVSATEESPPENVPDFTLFFSDYPFLLYATKFWLHHTFDFNQSTTKTWNLWRDRVNGSISRDDDELWANFGQQPPGFSTFDPKSWLANEDNLREATFRISISRRKAPDTEWIMLHKAIIFADFINHRPLLTHALITINYLTTIKDRRHNLSYHILERLLSKRKLFEQPLKREGYIREDSSYSALLHLVTEFIAWGGPMWPRMPHFAWRFGHDHDFDGEPLHWHMVRVLSESGYSRDKEPWLQLFAKIVVLKLTKETSDAIETWVNAKESCIHKFTTCHNQDIIDIILEIGGSSSFEYNSNYWRRKLEAAISGWKGISIEFYLQGIGHFLPTENEQEHCSIDHDLLKAIELCTFLPDDLRIQAITIATQEVTKGKQQRAYDEFEKIVASGSWDVAVVLSNYGLRLASMVSSDDEKRRSFKVLNDQYSTYVPIILPRLSEHG
ncbi:hypothetical protein CcaCcLH18_10544 [Colletotrichum camelliae]|nr:hypothetical protein CcaCcLH18_10544 [Colletotrichum camelliae]